MLVVATSEGMLDRLQEEGGDGEVGLALIYLRKAWEPQNPPACAYKLSATSHHRSPTIKRRHSRQELVHLVSQLSHPEY